MIHYTYQSLFTQSTYKDYQIYVYNGTTLQAILTNESLYQEELEHCQPLCTEDSIQYGSCESAYVKFKVSSLSTMGGMKGRKLLIYVIPEVGEGEEPESLQLGEFYVDSEKYSADKQYKEIIAYDKIHDIINADVFSWYSSLELPMTMLEFRTAFFNHFEVDQIPVQLCNDLMQVTYTGIENELPGLDVLNYICAANGALGTINNEGYFRYVYFSSTVVKEYEYNYKQGTLDYEDYDVQQINKLTVYSNKDVKVTIGSGDNEYIMQDNFLFYDKPIEILTPFIQNIYNIISATPVYKPLKVDTYGDPCIEVGDLISFTSLNGGTVKTLVLNKTCKGLQALTDTFETNGTESYIQDINSTDSKIRRAWGNVAEQVDGAKTYVYAQRPTKRNGFVVRHTNETLLFTIPIATTDACIPILLASIPVSMNLDGYLILRYYLDGIQLDDVDYIYLARGMHLVTISTYLELDANINKRFQVKAQTSYAASDDRLQAAKIASINDWIDNQTLSIDPVSGEPQFDYDYVEQQPDETPPTATIGSGKMRVMLFGSGLSPTVPWDGTILVTDTVSDYSFITPTVDDNIEESVSVVKFTPTRITVSDTITDVNFITPTVDNSIAEMIGITLHQNSVQRTDENEDIRVTEDGTVRYTEGD